MMIHADERAVIKVGILGLDSSHAPAFTKIINSSTDHRLRVVAAFPGGSDDLPTSRDRIAGFTAQMKELGVAIENSIDAVIAQVDAVLLESVDGRRHLEQAVPVFRAGKPVFIDKPLAANLTEAIAIDLLARHYAAKWFSSSALRFSPSIARYRDEKYQGKIRGAFAWSPASVDPTHVDLYWYGIHGVETLYTAMGQGCQSVSQTSTDGADVIVGSWSEGRIGTMRGVRIGASGFGMVVFTDQAIERDSNFEGYEPLVEQIDLFFQTGQLPVSNEETLEMMTFMQAAYESKLVGGARMEMHQVWDKYRAEAEKIVAKILNTP